MFIRCDKSVFIFDIGKPAIKHTKIDGPDTCPSRQVNHSLRVLDWRQVEFPMHQHQGKFVQHVHAVIFWFIVGEQVH